MKAALLIEPGRIEIHDIDVPRIKSSEVLIEVKSCGVCATDVKKYTGDSKTPNLPFILGHEPAGLIVEVGSGVSNSLKPGMRVAVAPVILCGVCHFCRSGIAFSQGMGMCSNYKVLGNTIDGAFAEYLIAPAVNVYPIPDDLPFKNAAIIEPVAACINGAQRTNPEIPGSIVVIGAGFMGLICTQILKILGNQVIVTDPIEDRRKLALSIGADLVLDPTSGDLNKTVLEITNGHGANGVIVAIGSKAIVEQGLSLLRKGGKIVLLASAQSGVKFEVDLNKLHYDQSVIIGSLSYTGPGYLWAIDLLTKNKLATELLITQSGPLEKTQEFLEMTSKRQGIKKVILL